MELNIYMHKNLCILIKIWEFSLPQPHRNICMTICISLCGCESAEYIKTDKDIIFIDKFIV